MKWCAAVFVLIFLTGCAARQEIPERQRAVTEYLESKGYQVVSYEGSGGSFLLTKALIVEMPYIAAFGVQSFDVSAYLDQTFEVEKFIVKNHPLSGDKVDVGVFVVGGQPIGGTAVAHGDTRAGGFWSLDGKTLEEVQGKTYPEWLKDWQVKYTE